MAGPLDGRSLFLSPSSQLRPVLELSSLPGFRGFESQLSWTLIEELNSPPWSGQTFAPSSKSLRSRQPVFTLWAMAWLRGSINPWNLLWELDWLVKIGFLTCLRWCLGSRLLLRMILDYLWLKLSMGCIFPGRVHRTLGVSSRGFSSESGVSHLWFLWSSVSSCDSTSVSASSSSLPECWVCVRPRWHF